MAINATGTIAVTVEIAVVTTAALKEQMLINLGVDRGEKTEEWTEVDGVVVNSVATKEAQVIVPTIFLEENLNHKIKRTYKRYVFY